MKIAYTVAELGAVSRSVVTIGNFDGVHCGHRSVIRRVTERARELDAKSVLVTFDPHPAAVLRPEGGPALITPLPRKLELLAETGVDCVLVLPFDATMRSTTARAFAADLLCGALHAMEVHEGENFRFGYQAEGDVAGLAELGRELGFSVVTYAPLHRRGGPVSSSRIRRAIGSADLATARALLGQPFAVSGTPASGRGYGTRYAVPTINLAAYDGLLPAHGVYVTELKIGTGGSAVRFEGVTNVGNRPTFGADSFAVETFLLRFTPVDLTENTPLLMTFHLRLRPEQKWSSPAALKQQIGKDVARAERWFELRRLLTGEDSRQR